MNEAKPPETEGEEKTSSKDARNKAHSTEGSEEASLKEAEDAREQRKKHGKTARGKRELNAYLRSAAGEPNVRKNVRLGPRGASAPIIPTK
ncbi:hypothetical protein NDU88_001181 [Pleurodeles waltl]|uniref:Uncharacterized protein n=1 Tax=Pleurodeles waltl TaxID=8319 RepID=A0AAV7P500_PLEWA|nr:hypothetical protein NDU88_001181 [Pleurodeles waltl]